MDVSKLKVDGKVYNIKDSDARKKLETFENTWRPVSNEYNDSSIPECSSQTQEIALSIYGAYMLFQNCMGSTDSAAYQHADYAHYRISELGSAFTHELSSKVSQELGTWTPEKNPAATVPFEFVQASGNVQNPGNYVINGKLVTLTTIAQVLDDDTISNVYSKVHVQVSSFPFVPKNIIAVSFIQNTATAYDTGFKMINYGQTIESKDSFVFDWEGKQATRVNVTIQYTI